MLERPAPPRALSAYAACARALVEEEQRVADLVGLLKEIDVYWESGNFSRDAALWRRIKDAIK